MNNKKLYSTAFLIGFILSFAILSSIKVFASKSDKITLCHKTHSDTNPWVVQTVNANEVESHLDNGDFVIDNAHQCPPVSATPIPTIIPSVVPTIIPSVIPSIVPTIVSCDGNCVTPTPVVTVSPTVAPTVSPTTAPTAEPTSVPASSGSGGGGSDGRSDGRSSTPQPIVKPCTSTTCGWK